MSLSASGSQPMTGFPAGASSGPRSHAEALASLTQMLSPPPVESSAAPADPAPGESPEGTTEPDTENADVATEAAPENGDLSQSDPTTDDDGEATDDAEAEDEAAPSKGLDKRNAKLDRQLADLKAKLAEKKRLAEELAQLPADEELAAATKPASPTVENATTFAQLEQAQESAQTAERICEKLIRRALREGVDELTIDQAAEIAGEDPAVWRNVYGDGKVFKVDDLETRLDTVRRDLRTGIPARAKYLQEHTAATQAARSQFAYLADKTQPLHAAAAEAKRSFPALRQLPNHEMVIGFTLLGQSLVQAASEGKLDPATVSAMKKFGGFSGQVKAPAATPPPKRKVTTPAKTATPTASPQSKWDQIGKDPRATIAALSAMLE